MTRGYTANMKKYFEKDSERIKNVAWQKAICIIYDI